MIKVCGLNDPEAVCAAVEAGADAVGLVLAPSVRQVTLEQAATLLDAAGPIRKVAVFRGLDRALLPSLRALPFDAVQAEADSLVDLAPDAVGALDLVPVFNDGDGLADRVAALGHLAGDGPVLVDGPWGGGSGIGGDRARIGQLARTRPLILAGGLSPENVADAIRAVRPSGVDVSSGVERAPGVKDPRRIAAFVRAARAALEETR